MTKNEKIEFDMLAHCATGFLAQDLTLGKNVRDGSGNADELGNLLRKDRGYPLNELIVVAGEKGTGKTTKVLKDIGNIIKTYPVKKVLVFDSDFSYKPDRIRYLTGLTYDEVDEMFDIISVKDGITVEVVDAKLAAEHKAYLKTAEAVDFYDPIDRRNKKVMPIVIVVVDSLSSLNIDNFSITNSDETNNIMSMQRWGKIANHVERTLGFLKDQSTKKPSGNFLAFYVAHRKDNNSTNGQTVKENKTGGTAKKNHIPERLRQISSTIMEMSATSVPSNPESPNRIENLLGIEKPETLTYEVTVNMGKTRTGSDGDTQFQLVFTDATVDPYLSNVLFCVREGIFEKSQGMHPVKDSDFRGNPLKLRSGSKQSLKMNGYDRTFSVTEASRFGKYLPPLVDRQKALMSPEDIDKYMQIHAMAWEFNVAMSKAINKFLEYELEANAISTEEQSIADIVTKQLYDEIY